LRLEPHEGQLVPGSVAGVGVGSKQVEELAKMIEREMVWFQTTLERIMCQLAGCAVIERLVPGSLLAAR
jgi:hypothetical protein